LGGNEEGSHLRLIDFRSWGGTMSQALRMMSRSSTLYSMNDLIDDRNPHTACGGEQG